MNIFAINPCPLKSAQYVYKDNPKRGIKMILECAQLLCTALNEKGYITPYKSSHKGHICQIWASESYSNWKWVANHGLELARLYTNDYNKIHKSEKVIKNLLEMIQPEMFEKTCLTMFVNCAKNKSLALDFTNINNVHTAYKKYLKARMDIKNV